MKLTTLFLLVALTASPISGMARSIRGLPENILPLLWQGTPGFSVSPAPPINVGPSAVGVTISHAFPVRITINNPGTAPLVISSTPFDPQFGFTAESTIVPGLTINAGTSREADVLFTPTAAGTRTGAITINDNAPGSPHQIQFTGLGVAVPANDYGLALDPGTPSPVSVPAGGSATFPVWVLGGPQLPFTQLNLQCSGGKGCSLDGNQADVAGDPFAGTRQKIMLTVSVGSASMLPVVRPTFWWAFYTAVMLLLLYFLKLRPKMRIVLAAAMIILLISCGGGNSSSNTVTLTAMPAQGSSGTTHSLSIPLAVH
jgi:Abnormal spindle-like microcephaly-assoc'd, ASPM-SPD-2-Hydin